MQRITQLVRSAVGFNEQRGDQVEVVNVQFAAPQNAPGTEAQAPGMFDVRHFRRDAHHRAGGDAARLARVRVLRASSADRRLGARRRAGRGGGPPAACPHSRGPRRDALPGAPVAAGCHRRKAPMADIEPAIDIAQIQGRVRASSVKKVAEVVDKHPDESMQIIRGWLNNAM